MAILLEDLMTYAITTNDDKARIGFQFGSIALEALLQAAWPSTQGEDNQPDEGSVTDVDFADPARIFFRGIETTLEQGD